MSLINKEINLNHSLTRLFSSAKKTFLSDDLVFQSLKMEYYQLNSIQYLYKRISNLSTNTPMTIHCLSEPLPHVTCREYLDLELLIPIYFTFSCCSPKLDRLAGKLPEGKKGMLRIEKEPVSRFSFYFIVSEI